MDDVQYPVETELEWWRGPARVQGEYVVIDVRKIERYVLGTSTGGDDDLAFDYARIASPDDVVRFVSQWGLPTAGPESGPITEPIAPILADAQHLRTIFEMYADLLGFVQQGLDYEPVHQWAPVLEKLGSAGDSGPHAMAGIAAYLVNDALGAVTLTVAVNPNFGQPDEAPFVASIGAPDLRSYIYFHAATLLMGSEPVRRCEECRRPYSVNHPRQRYCSETCGSRARQRRFVEKKEADRG